MFVKSKDLDLEPNEELYIQRMEYFEKILTKTELTDYEKYIKESFKSKEEYALAESKFRTYAILTENGEWLEDGYFEFGCEIKSVDFTKKFYEILKSTNPEYYVTLVDCHI